MFAFVFSRNTLGLIVVMLLGRQYSLSKFSPKAAIIPDGLEDQPTKQEPIATTDTINIVRDLETVRASPADNPQVQNRPYYFKSSGRKDDGKGKNNESDGDEANKDESKNMDEADGPMMQADYNGTNSFGACLYWMDDYERLTEWIAYHWQVLPLRHLVFFRDPKSSKDPTPILERWKPYMNITYWTTIDKFTHVPSKNTLARLEGRRRRLHYRTQHVLFYKNCLNHLKAQSWTWTWVGDTDEYLLLNSRSLPAAHQMMQEPGIIFKTLKAARSPNRTISLQNNLSIDIPIKSQRQKERWGNESRLCVSLMRNQFSGYDSPPAAVANDVPAFFDPYRFQTMRFRYHKKKTMIGKSIIDSSRVSMRKMTRVSVHKIIRACGTPWGMEDDLMQVNHYLGTWDYFDRPNDARGQSRFDEFIKKNAEVKKTIMAERADEIRPWLKGFVKSFGSFRALELLEGIGVPYNNRTALPTIEVEN